MERVVLETEFEDMGLSISDDILDECTIACITNKVSASDLVGSWIAYCASFQFDANDLNKEKLNTLIKSFKTDSGYKVNAKRKYIEDESDSQQSINHMQSLNCETSNIEIENDINVSAIIDGKSDVTEENKSSVTGDLVCELGRGNVNKSDPSADVKTVGLLNQESWREFVFGQAGFQLFSMHIKKLVDDIVKKNNLNPLTSFSELESGFDKEVTIAGTIKLIKKELFISSEYGLIKLDLSEIEKPIKSLFQNQILVATATNPETKDIKVKKLYTDASLPQSSTLPTFSQGNINLMVAAGPFFSESSPHGQLLKSLIQKTIELEANMLILLGPIFESDFGLQLNKTSSDGLQRCYDDVLKAVLNPLFSNPSTKNTKLVILSSWKDSSFAFYPTPPNTESLLPELYPDNIFMVSDPCLFSVNDVIIAGNTSDSLMSLRVSAINQTQEEMFEILSKHIIWQRCLHPSFSSNSNVPVDQSLWLQHSVLQQNTPHIIVTSSKLRTFIRIVDGCMVINVGQLTKQNSGTYSKIQISPPKNGIWSPESNISAEVIYI